MSALPPPHNSARRAALLEQLIVALTAPAGGALALPIRTRAADDPTIALLDAWATVGDVLGFYLDRIADEGYLSTAVQPGSILALAALTGYQPAPGLAAQAYLAYTLGADPADGAVQFSPGLLVQSVPGPGLQPQTFESVGPLTGRPSWNLLTPRSGQPLAASATSLVIDGTATAIAPNDMILLALAGAPAGIVSQNPVRVATATMDYSAKVTNVTLQAPAVAADPAPPVPAPAPPPSDLTGAIDGLLTGGLGKAAPPVPASASQLPQTAKSVFSGDSDAVPRLLATLQPAVAPVLYAALGTTPVGTPTVTGASLMQVRAAPFGASAPPQPVFGPTGQPAGTRDWPIGEVFTLELSLTVRDFLHLRARAVRATSQGDVPGEVEALATITVPAVIDVQWSAATFTGQATIDTSGLPATARPQPGGFGQVEVQPGNGIVTLSYAGYTPPADAPAPSPPATPALQVNAGFDPSTNAVTFDFVDPGTQDSLGSVVWDTNMGTPVSGRAGDMQVTIAWTAPPAGGDVVSLTIATPLPLPAAEQAVLLLDGTYPGITAGSYVVIDSARPAPAASVVRYPVITTVAAADTVAANGYGITSKVTRLVLTDNWIDDSARLQSALRPVTIHAQPAVLPLRPAPVTADVSGASIDLGTLVAGMDPGRLIAVTGTRTDLPAGANIRSGEVAMVASVSAGAGGGAVTYSTLNLAAPLAYSYQRDSVQIYGNVVGARQGATITEVLGSGQPAQAPQMFTLSSGPVLADPAPTGTGAASTLSVTVDGIGYAQAGRYDSSTPAQSYLVGTDASGHTTITFPAPLPAGTGNISASYRAGDGSQGNMQPGQITQLLSRPASLSSVTNPLPATGGTGGQDQESVRAAVPGRLSGLGRAVTIADYASLASSVAGVGKASATAVPGAGVIVTIAGTAPVQLDPGGGLCAAVAAAIGAAGPAAPVQVLPASVYLIALTANVVREPLVSWTDTVSSVRAALLARFGYAQRDLGRDVAVSDLLAAAHGAPGVRSVTITGVALVPAAAPAAALATTLPALLTGPVLPVARLADVTSQWNLAPSAAAAVAYLSGTAPGTVILSETSP